MIFLNPSKRFTQSNVPWENESEILVKIQIENSLSLGWKPEDIILVTNFGYRYKGVQSMIVPDRLFYQPKPTATKIFVILYLFEKGFINDDLWWFHDLDAFQLEKIKEKEIGLGEHAIALTDYGKSSVNEKRSERWSTGSMFFDKRSLPVFELIKSKVLQYQMNEEVMLLMLTRINKSNINSMIKKLNITYNLATRKRDILRSYNLAEKPLKVIHFHPFDDRPLDLESGRNNIEVCVFGKNRIHKPLINQRLKKLFVKHKII